MIPYLLFFFLAILSNKKWTVNMKENLRSIEDSADDCINLHDSDIYKEAVSEQTPSYNLKFYRKLNGLTQKELADELGIAKQYVSNMETGERSISRQMAKNLAEIFKVSPARFI